MPHSPKNPYIILAASLLLPGSGHVLLGLAQRGLMFLFFILILGWISLRLMPEQMSFFARHVGGILVYGLSVLDAYKIARVRKAEHDHLSPPKSPESFLFQEVPLFEVLHKIQEVYGLKIIPSANLKDCVFTGDLNGLELYEQLEFICKSINAQIEKQETNILIKGEGCR